MKKYTWKVSELVAIAEKRGRPLPQYIDDYRAIAKITGRVITDENGQETAFEIDEDSPANLALMQKYRPKAKPMNSWEQHQQQNLINWQRTNAEMRGEQQPKGRGCPCSRVK